MEDETPGNTDLEVEKVHTLVVDAAKKHLQQDGVWLATFFDIGMFFSFFIKVIFRLNENFSIRYVHFFH